MFNEARILAFHQTSTKYYPGINNLKPGYFFEIIDLIESLGFSFWKKGGDDVSPTTAVITFDDGYADNYDVLLRLCERGITPIVFIPTDFIDMSNTWEYSHRLFPARHLNQKQILVLSEAGVLFGSHGKSHSSLVHISGDRLFGELHDSKKKLEDIAEQTIEFLSYPFGRFNRKTNLEAIEVGYSYGFLLAKPMALVDSSDEFIFYRTPIYSIDDYYSLEAKLIRNSAREIRKCNIINWLAGGTIITGTSVK